MSAQAELTDLVRQLHELTGATRKRFGPLTVAQLNWRPAPESWSVGQCFEHLIKTNEQFMPTMEQVAQGAYRASAWQRLSPFSGYFGRLVIRGLQPDSTRKVKAPARIQPAANTVTPQIIDDFAVHQEHFAGLMGVTAHTDLRRTIVTSPVAAIATYNLLDAYRIVVLHERRHFEQAQRVTETAGFPRA